MTTATTETLRGRVQRRIAEDRTRAEAAAIERAKRAAAEKQKKQVNALRLQISRDLLNPLLDAEARGKILQSMAQDYSVADSFEAESDRLSVHVTPAFARAFYRVPDRSGCRVPDRRKGGLPHRRGRGIVSRPFHDTDSAGFDALLRLGFGRFYVHPLALYAVPSADGVRFYTRAELVAILRDAFERGEWEDLQ